MMRMDFLNVLKTRIYTVHDIEELFVINGETVRKWIREEKLDAVSLGSNKEGFIILDWDLKAFIENHPKYARIYDLVVKETNELNDQQALGDLILSIFYGKISCEKYNSIYYGMLCDFKRIDDLLTFIKPIVTESTYNVVEFMVNKGIERMPKRYRKFIKS